LAARILDGKALAQTWKERIGREVAEIQARKNRVPGLTVVLVGENPASEVYVRNKQNACKAAGMRGTLLRLPGDVEEARLLATIDQLNADPDVHGILVQLPLPSQIDDRKVIERVDPRKDVDGFHPENAGLLAIGHEDQMLARVAQITEERDRMAAALAHLDVEVWPSEANFILFRPGAGAASEVWQALLSHGVLVRDCSSWNGLGGCLRVTVGTPEENSAFLGALDAVLRAVPT